MVSVIIPNYNHSQYLKQRVDSILNQTYTDFEIILLDDCSSDLSRDIIEEYRGNKKVEHIVYNDTNSGSTFKQWQKGILLARGEYIWIAESDDYADPFFLEAVMKGFENKDNVVLSYSQSHRVNQDNVITGNWIDQTISMFNINFFSSDFIQDGLDFIRDFLIEKNVIPNASAVVFKKDIYNKCGGINFSIKYCGDWYLWLKILTYGSVSFTKKSLNFFRYHSQSVIAEANNANTNIVSFDKKYDIIMRFFYQDFLNKNSDKFKEIIQQNRVRISNESLIESIISRRNKKYFELFFYLYQAIKYSDSRIHFTMKLLKKRTINYKRF